MAIMSVLPLLTAFLLWPGCVATSSSPSDARHLLPVREYGTPEEYGDAPGTYVHYEWKKTEPTDLSQDMEVRADADDAPLSKRPAALNFLEPDVLLCGQTVIGSDRLRTIPNQR